MRIAINNPNAQLGGEKGMRDVIYMVKNRHYWRGREIISQK